MRWIKRIRVEQEGLSLAADINAAVSINDAEPGTTQTVRSESHVRVVQDSRRDGPREPWREATSEDKEEPK